MDITNLNKDRKSRRKSGIDLNPMIYGKLPPQAKDLEEAILGAVMLEKNAFDTVIEILRPDCFYVDTHQRIYAAFVSLADKNMPIDILTVVEELKSRGDLEIVGGPYYITKLTNSVVSTANLEAHARIVLQKFVQRELIRISGEIIGDAYEDGTDVFDLMDDAEEKIFNITNNFLKTDYKSMGNALTEAINRIDELRNSTEDISGVPSGYSSLDKVTFGWQPTDLIILAARPSVGKTAFALNLARNAALHPTKPTGVGFFSLEMSASQLVQRILSAESEIPMQKIARGKLEEHEYSQLQKKGIEKLIEAPIYIDDTAALNIFEFRAKARRLVNKHKVGLIIIDYLQLMSGQNDRNSNREQEISNISRNLKALAKELNIPIIALSQLNRAVESRASSKVPLLSDLRESGAIEQDADLVMFIYRNEMYENYNSPEGADVKDMTMIKIAKHRNGSLEEIKLRAMLSIQKFADWNDDGFSPGGNFKYLGSSPPGDTQGIGGKLYLQKGSRMNSGEFDEGIED